MSIIALRHFVFIDDNNKKTMDSAGVFFVFLFGIPLAPLILIYMIIEKVAIKLTPMDLIIKNYYKGKEE